MPELSAQASQGTQWPCCRPDPELAFVPLWMWMYRPGSYSEPLSHQQATALLFVALSYSAGRQVKPNCSSHSSRQEGGINCGGRGNAFSFQDINKWSGKWR